MSNIPAEFYMWIQEEGADAIFNTIMQDFKQRRNQISYKVVVLPLVWDIISKKYYDMLERHGRILIYRENGRVLQIIKGDEE